MSINFSLLVSKKREENTVTVSPPYTTIKHVKRGKKELRERRFYFQESSKCRLEETPKEVPPTTPSAGREKEKKRKEN